jgi:hypothetical protein
MYALFRQPGDGIYEYGRYVIFVKLYRLTKNMVASPRLSKFLAARLLPSVIGIVS